MENQHKEPPTTVKEVGIHIGYLRDGIHTIEKKLDDVLSIAATKAELARLETRVATIEKELEEIKDRETSIYRRVTVVVASALVLMVLAWYGLDRFV